MKKIKATNDLEVVTKLSKKKLFGGDFAYSGCCEFFGIDDDEDEKFRMSKVTEICRTTPQKVLDYFKWTVEKETFLAFGIMDGTYKNIIKFIEYK